MRDLRTKLVGYMVNKLHLHGYEAEDIFQEVFIQLFNRIIFTFRKDMFENGGLSSSFEACLHTACRNGFKHYVRDDGKRRKREHTWLRENWCVENEESGTLDVMWQNQCAALLRGAIHNELTPRERQTIGYRFDGLDYAKIAEQTGGSANGERMSYVRGKRTLTEFCRQYELELADLKTF